MRLGWSLRIECLNRRRGAGHFPEGDRVRPRALISKAYTTVKVWVRHIRGWQDYPPFLPAAPARLSRSSAMKVPCP